jgi:hypothetical protein
MSIGIDQHFRKLSLQSEEDLYRESMTSPIIIREEQRTEILGRIPREKLQRIAFECLFFLAALVIAVSLGYLLYLLLAAQIQDFNQGIEVAQSDIDGLSEDFVKVRGQFLADNLLFGVFSLCALVGIYLVRVIQWSVKILLEETAPA